MKYNYYVSIPILFFILSLLFKNFKLIKTDPQMSLNIFQEYFNYSFSERNKNPLPNKLIK